MEKTNKKIMIMVFIMMLALSPVIVQSAYAEELGTTELQENISTEVTEQENTILEDGNEETENIPIINEGNEESEGDEEVVKDQERTSEPEIVGKKEPVALNTAKVKKENQQESSNKSPIKKKPTATVKVATTQQNVEEVEKEKPKAQVKASLEPSSTNQFVFEFLNLEGNAKFYDTGEILSTSILIDVTTDEEYDFKFIVVDYPNYSAYLEYSVDLLEIPETRANFGEELTFNIAANTSYKNTGAAPRGNYRIFLSVFNIFEDEDTGFIRINKQRNTANITVDKEVNPSTINFENEGDSDNQTYDWEIVDENGNIVSIGTGKSVPSDNLDDLPEGNYTVNLTTKGDSQYGNAVQEKTATDTFKIVYGELVVTHTTIDADGNETEIEVVVTREKTGTDYTTKPMEIPGYKLVEKPSNATGEYTEDGVLVEYFYEIIKPDLTVKYVDENGKELHKPVKSTGVYDEDYDTEEKSFEGYELIAIPSNASGTFGEDDIIVTYVYRLIDDGDGGSEGGDEGGDEGNEGSGGNEGSETGGSSGGDIDPSKPGTGETNGNSGGGTNEASESGAWNYGSSAQTGILGELPQTGSQGVIVTGFAGGIMTLIGAVLLLARRKF